MIPVTANQQRRNQQNLRTPT